ncbi:hypothetical protein ABT215_04940 [Streptomyces sp900105755]|uniref:hypothetical protein n=1 Tax=Streptomyces sp. 900105755 TaxID=3154389 RepID=UPI003326F46C
MTWGWSVVRAPAARTEEGILANATLGLTTAVNSKFRVRAEYVHSNKDTGNLNTWGAWQYFTVSR